MKKIFVTGIICCSLATAKAQFTYDYLRAADNYYKKADYYSAAQYYEKYLGTATQKLKRDEYSPYTVPSSAPKKQSTCKQSAAGIIPGGRKLSPAARSCQSSYVL